MPASTQEMKVSLTRCRADLVPNSLNEQDRSFEVTVATGYPVRNYDWTNDRYFNEVLVCEPSAVRTQRLDNGAPVLDNHNRYSGVKGQLGKISAHRFENGTIVATMRLSKRSELDGLWQDIKDGIVTNISVGYKVHRYEATLPADDSNEVPTYRAVDWEPMEVSLVPVPADPNSTVRSEEGAYNVSYQPVSPQKPTPQIIMTPEEQARAEAEAAALQARGEGGNPAPAPSPTPAPANAVNVEAIQREAALAEKKRSADIRELVRSVNLNAEFANKLIDDSVSIDAARAAVIEELTKKDVKVRSTGPSVGSDANDRWREDATNGLILRSSAVPEKALELTPEQLRNARSFQRMMPVDLARMSLERSGESNIGYDREDILKRAITSNSSDFAVLLEGTNRRILEAAYAAEPFDWDKWCSTGSVGDFRKYERVQMHDSFNRLAPVEENGEYETFAINDAERQYVQVFTYGKKFNLTRKMLINDDLGAFTRLMAMFARAAARSIQIDAYSALKSNSGLGPILADSKTLFHADHGNIATTPGVFGTAVWDAMRVQMATQKPFGGKVDDFLNYRPEILLCSTALGSAARLLNNSQYDPTVTNKFQIANIVAGLFNEIVDTPWLSGAPYYGFTSPNVSPVMEVTFLDGNRAPMMDSQVSWETDGIEYKCRLDYGIAGVGYKGAIYNAG